MARGPRSRGPSVPVLLVLLLAAACSQGAETGQPEDDGRLRVVTTVAPITSIVSNIVGDRALVTGIVPEGTNSHTFEPRPAVAEVLATADLIFMNGLVLEEPTKRLAQRNMGPEAELIELGTETLAEDRYLYDFSFPEEEGAPNPHLWTDPTLVRRYAELVAEHAAERDPDNAGYYRDNLDALAERIDALDRAMRTAFATVPEADRKLVTYHDAYAYFARSYGWTVVGAIQVSDFEDPTAREVADLIDQIRREDVKAIFGSEVFPSPVLEQIGRETGVRYVDVLRDDDLPGEPGDPEHSWLGLMRFDFATIVESLGGDASALVELDVSNVAPDNARYPQ